MPVSHTHEGLVRLFREHPSLATELLAAGGRDADPLGESSDLHIELDAENVTDLDPAERRADVVLRLLDAEGVTRHALILEVQLTWDPDKLFRWPAYAATLRDRRRCEVEVVVITIDAAIARRCAEPIRLGRWNWFAPIVIGPDSMPTIADAAAAERSPALAVLSALARPNLASAILAIEASSRLDPRDAALYFELLIGSVSDALRRAIEEYMANENYEIQSEFLLKYIAKGRDEGLAKGRDEGLAKGRDEGLARGRLEASRSALLAVLDARGLQVSPEQRATILEEPSAERIQRWIRAAARLATVDEVLAERA